LTSSSVLEQSSLSEKAAARRSFLLVFFCTLIGAVAQILIKTGTGQMGAHITLSDVVRAPSLFVQFCLGMLQNGRMFAGYCLLGVNTFLIALALRGRELSRLYPIIALTYVWVTFLSLFLLPEEHMNFFRTAGICFVVGGVSILGRKTAAA
jgi:multidrug transporter EmrE-like cation transporter